MKRCPTCCVLLPRSAFALNLARHDGLQSQCRECQSAHYRDGATLPGAAPHTIGRQTDPEIMARIQARAAARPQRLRPPPGPATYPRKYGGVARAVRKGVGHLVKDAAFVRCCLPSVPDDARVLGLRHRDVPCGALLFAGDELDHLVDVHGIDRIEGGAFVAVEDREEECA